MRSPICIALDFATEREALQFIEPLSPDQCRLKVGKELFTVGGPQLVRRLVDQGFDVFLDLKFHDIPNTVAHAIKAAADLGVWMVNVHASGGRRMLEAARQALPSSQAPLLIAVTVLTSMEQQDLAETGIQTDLTEHILQLAHLSQQAGLDGVVCSAREVQLLRQQCGSNFCLVTPGIRPINSSADDQRRTMTPVEAVQTGASYLVIGRPITQSANPLQTLTEINQSIGY